MVQAIKKSLVIATAQFVDKSIETREEPWVSQLYFFTVSSAEIGHKSIFQFSHQNDIQYVKMENASLIINADFILFL
jgi:hypothetical protein